MRPLIGITCYVERARWSVWEAPAALVPLAYVRTVEAAGGRPVVVPPSDEGLDETLDALHGVVLTGGADIDPKLYGAGRHPETVGIRRDRDRGEIALVEAALKRDLPVLAICRGMQLVNVVLGGDFVQHLPDVVDEDGHRTAPGVFARHDIEIAEGSRLHTILGPRASVASHHHQAPGRLGSGLKKVAWAADSTIEGVELPGKRLVVGVLWHPEEDEDRALFEALVEEAAGYRKEHA